MHKSDLVSGRQATDAPSTVAADDRAPGLMERARRIYRLSRKANDFLWARWVTRPFAAVLLAGLPGRRVTPNALSVVSLVLGLASCAAFGFWPGLTGLWVAWLLCQAAYTADCMDGMQARYRQLHSPAGASLDFLVDAIKQIFLFPAVGYRLWVQAGRPLDPVDGWPLWVALLIGPIVAGGLAATVFLRSPEVTCRIERGIRATPDRSFAGRVMAGVAFLMNYPSWILLPVALDRMDLFLLVSAPLYTLYLLYAWLLVCRRVCGVDHYDRIGRGQ